MKKTNTKLLGAFVVGGIFLLVIGVLVFGSGQWLETRLKRVAYFTEPLDGLNVGAPVKFRGVKIGTVTDIILDYNLRDLTFSTPVYFEINPSRFVTVHGEWGEQSERERNKLLIERGMRAQVLLDSIVTGQRAVTLVLRPDTEAVIVGHDADVIEVPTIPSETEELKGSVTEILTNIGKLDIQKINTGIVNLLDGAGKLVDSPELYEIISETNLLVPDARQLINNVDGEVSTLASSFRGAADQATVTLGRADGAVNEVRKAFKDAQGTLQKGDQVLDSANTVIKPGARTHFQMMEMMQEVTAAARSIRSLADTLQRNPESVLFGKTRGGGRQ